MPTATIRPLGESGLYHIHFLDAVDPGFGHGGAPHPDHGLPGSGAHPGNRPPGSGAHPGNRPPGSGGGIPDNELPSEPPPHVPAGTTLVLVRDPAGVWHYATLDANTPPPKPLPPGSIEHPGNRPPGSGAPPHPGGGPVPPTAGTPLPPTAAPKR